MVALVDGNVIVVPSVPASVSVCVAASVLPSVSVSVAPVAGWVSVSLLIDVAVATPRTGVTRVGDVARTPLPVPVVVIASCAVPPALIASIFPPFPVYPAIFAKPAAIDVNSARITDESRSESLLGSLEFA